MRVVVLIFTMLLLSKIGMAQKVGLVLSGGGAKGAAHVGVIKALEEHHIPIDYITGTSFGAIVGALYASGYTPEEMEILLKSDKFMAWAFGEINADDKFYYKHSTPNPSWLALRLEKRVNPLKTILPYSIFENHQMDLRLMEMFAAPAAAAHYNFDQLMVPFRCVATDVYRSKPVAFSKGDLAQAVRASITIPLIFKPIEIDGVLYMDGGMKNNFPSDIMIDEFNPDIILGSKVAFNSIVPRSDDVMAQIENIFTDHTDFSLPDSSLLIEPFVKEYSAADFMEIETLISLGYTATIDKIEMIKSKVASRSSDKELLEKRQEFQKLQPRLTFNNVIISGVEDKQKLYVHRNIKANRDTFSFKSFKKEYFLLLSDEHIRSVLPRALYNPTTGYFDLFIDVKTDYSLLVQIGGQINSTSKNYAFLGGTYKRLNKRAFLAEGSLYFGRMYSSMRGNARIDFPYFRNSNGKRLFPLFTELTGVFSRRDFFNSTKEWFFEDATPSYITQRETYVRLNAGVPITSNGFLSAGFTMGAHADDYYQTNMVSRTDKTDISRFDYLSPYVHFEYSTLNFKQFSTKGKFFKLLVRKVYGREEFLPGTTGAVAGLIETTSTHSYYDVNLQIENYHRITNRFFLGGYFQTYFSTKELFSNYLSTKLSADEFKPFPHTVLFYLPNFRANSYLALGVNPVFKITDAVSLRAGTFVYQPHKRINSVLYMPVAGKPFEKPFFLGNASMIYHSFIGPLYASLSYLDRDNNKWFFHFGFGFLLFNPGGLE